MGELWASDGFCGRASSTAPIVTATKGEHAYRAERAARHRLAEHDRRGGDRDGVGEQGRQPRDGERTARLAADLDQTGSDE
jgi:hypothetical protein